MKFITKEYWLESVSHFKKVKSIALMSIFIAVGVVIVGIFAWKLLSPLIVAVTIKKQTEKTSKKEE